MMQTTAVSATHKRDHRSVLAAAEKRALIWIAERLPRWVTSDQLTALGLASMAAAGPRSRPCRPHGRPWP